MPCHFLYVAVKAVPCQCCFPLILTWVVKEQRNSINLMYVKTKELGSEVSRKAGTLNYGIDFWVWGMFLMFWTLGTGTRMTTLHAELQGNLDFQENVSSHGSKGEYWCCLSRLGAVFLCILQRVRSKQIVQ